MTRRKTFVVEETRTARRYLSAAGLKGHIAELEFHELNEHTTQAEVEALAGLFDKGDVGLISEAGLPAVADPPGRAAAKRRAQPPDGPAERPPLEPRCLARQPAPQRRLLPPLRPAGLSGSGAPAGRIQPVAARDAVSGRPLGRPHLLLRKGYPRALPRPRLPWAGVQPVPDRKRVTGICPLAAESGRPDCPHPQQRSCRQG